MRIKARPFTTRIGDADVEGLFDGSEFVFRFYNLIEFRPPVLDVGEDEYGKYVLLEETEVSQSDGFTFVLEIGVDAVLECAWGYVLTFRRDDIGDRALVESILREKGVDPDSAILVIPPRQLLSISFDPRGEIDGSSRTLDEENAESILANEAVELHNKVRASASQRILFLPHAVRQMSRPNRMITTGEVRSVVERGIIIEAYADDPRGASCLLLGHGAQDRPIHVGCSPKVDFLAIITAYLPNPHEWSDDFKVRIKR